MLSVLPFIIALLIYSHQIFVNQPIFQVFVFLDLKAHAKRALNGHAHKAEDEKNASSHFALEEMPRKKRKRRRKVKDYDWSSKPGKHKRINSKKLDSDPGKQSPKNHSETTLDESLKTTPHYSVLRSSNNSNSNNANQLHTESNPHFVRASTRNNTLVQSRLTFTRNKRNLKLAFDDKKRSASEERVQQPASVATRRLRSRDSLSTESPSEEKKMLPSTPPHSNGTFLGLGPQYQSIKQAESLCKAQVAFAQPWISGLTSRASKFSQDSFNYLSNFNSTKRLTFFDKQQNRILFSKYRDLSHHDHLDEDDITSTSDAESSSLEDETTSNDEDCQCVDVIVKESQESVQKRINANTITSLWRSAKVVSKPLLADTKENNSSFGLGAPLGVRGDAGKYIALPVKRKRGRPRKHCLKKCGIPTICSVNSNNFVRKFKLRKNSKNRVQAGNSEYSISIKNKTKSEPGSKVRTDQHEELFKTEKSSNSISARDNFDDFDLKDWFLRSDSECQCDESRTSNTGSSSDSDTSNDGVESGFDMVQKNAQERCNNISRNFAANQQEDRNSQEIDNAVDIILQTMEEPKLRAASDDIIDTSVRETFTNSSSSLSQVDVLFFLCLYYFVYHNTSKLLL